MHQDQRIGLAFGVLLVGACAAFFFRNETREITNVPRLHHAEQLDDRIAERSNRPYLKGVEAVEAADRSRTRSDSSGQNSARDEKGASFWSPAEPSEDHQAGSGRGRTTRARLIESENDIQELAPIPVPTDNALVQSRPQQNERVDEGRNAAHLSQSSIGSASDSRTHIVQKGDTLSSIAAKYLGNSGRFHEIFAANQDQLKDANDVRQGMSLRIPDSRAGSVSAPAAAIASGTASKPPVMKANPAIGLEPSNAVRPPQKLDALHEAEPPAYDIRRSNDGSDAEERPSILLPPELPGDTPRDFGRETSLELPVTIPAEPRPDVPSELPAADESPSLKKFVPTKKLPPPMRHGGPQARSAVGGRKLSQASLESTSGKVAR